MLQNIAEMPKNKFAYYVYRHHIMGGYHIENNGQKFFTDYNSACEAAKKVADDYADYMNKQHERYGSYERPFNWRAVRMIVKPHQKPYDMSITVHRVEVYDRGYLIDKNASCFYDIMAE